MFNIFHQISRELDIEKRCVDIIVQSIVEQKHFIMTRTQLHVFSSNQTGFCLNKLKPTLSQSAEKDFERFCMKIL